MSYGLINYKEIIKVQEGQRKEREILERIISRQDSQIRLLEKLVAILESRQNDRR